jgi:hypothetical protein
MLGFHCALYDSLYKTVIYKNYSLSFVKSFLDFVNFKIAQYYRAHQGDRSAGRIRRLSRADNPDSPFQHRMTGGVAHRRGVKNRDVGSLHFLMSYADGGRQQA